MAAQRKKRPSSRPVKKSGKAAPKRAKSAPKKTRSAPAKRKSAAGRKKAVADVRRGVRGALNLMVTSISIFLLLFLFGLTFWMYQWKEHQIVEMNKEIQRLHVENQESRSEISRRKAKIGKELLVYDRIREIAGKQLGLKPSLTAEIPLTVDQEKLAYYVEKDHQTK